MNIQDLAPVILNAMNIREESYDHSAADRAKAFADTVNEERDKSPVAARYPYMVDYSKFYRLTMEQACEQAVRQAGMDGTWENWFPVYMMIQYGWNDMEHWARYVSDPAYKAQNDEETRQFEEEEKRLLSNGGG